MLKILQEFLKTIHMKLKHCTYTTIHHTPPSRLPPALGPHGLWLHTLVTLASRNGSLLSFDYV